jgi:hypothetical protein
VLIFIENFGCNNLPYSALAFEEENFIKPKKKKMNIAGIDPCNKSAPRGQAVIMDDCLIACKSKDIIAACKKEILTRFVGTDEGEITEYRIPWIRPDLRSLR